MRPDVKLPRGWVTVHSGGWRDLGKLAEVLWKVFVRIRTEVPG